jgi:hypothetical protein
MSLIAWSSAFYPILGHIYSIIWLIAAADNFLKFIGDFNATLGSFPVNSDASSVM